jgi:hypothetical protein
MQEGWGIHIMYNEICILYFVRCAKLVGCDFRYAGLAKKLEGMKLLILDEVSMISLESLYFIEREVSI